MSLSEAQIEERCENARDALGYSNACCPRDDVPMCTDCSRLRAPALAVLELADDVESALAEVRRLREENGRLARKIEALPVSVEGPHTEYAWTTGGSEVDRLKTIIRDLDRKHIGALKERNAAKAALAEAVELLHREHHPSCAPVCDGCAFLAEHGAK